jgi:hypothetical protein
MWGSFEHVNETLNALKYGNFLTGSGALEFLDGIRGP